MPRPAEAARAPADYAACGRAAYSVPRIAALGGGTGLPVLLRGLRKALRPARPGTAALRDRLTAIVTVADDGGSSGRLRRDYGVLPPGDMRNCLVALSDGQGALAALFGHRFNGHGEIAGHSLGNLILTALSQMEHRFVTAVDRAAEILAVSGRVLPATAQAVRLVAEFEDGSRVEGESRIAAVRRRIRSVRLRPEHVPALPEALEAVTAADCVVIGPGSLYTSLIPVLLVRGLAKAIADSGARVVLVMNLMSEPGETDGLTAVDHVQALRDHAPHLPIHDVILNDAPVAAPVCERYAAKGAHALALDAAALRARGCGVWAGDLLAGGARVRHDPAKLARAVLEAAAKRRPTGELRT